MTESLLQRAIPPVRRRAPGIIFGGLADGCVIGLLALSMWLIVRAGEQPPILYLTFAIVGVRALAIGRAGFRYAERIASHDAVFAQLSELRTATFTSLIPRVPGAIETHRRGEVLSAFVDDVDQLQDEPLRVRQPLLVSAVVIGLTLIAIAILSPVAALVLAVMLALSGSLSAWLSARTSARSDRELSAARAALTDALLERFAAAEVLAAFDAEPQQRARIREAERRLSRAQLERSRSAGLTGALLALGSGLASLLTLLLLAPSVGHGLTAPMFAAIVIVPAAVFEVFAQVPQALVSHRTVTASAERIADLTERPLPPEIPREDPVEEAGEGSAEAVPREGVDPSVATRSVPGAPLIEVAGLGVRYPGANAPAVTGLEFSVAPGETLVVTGESGSGKTTLALALVRLLEYSGSYRLRGIEARDLPVHEVRASVGLCEQTPHLFDADLRQNLWFAHDTADDDELMAALDRVGLGEWARSRGGLDAQVGERGALVSGGQAQRIALARAILADFPVVVLDEPTAGVDREQADTLLADLLSAVPEDRAVILITHTDLPAGLDTRRLEL